MERSPESELEYVIMPWDDHNKIIYSGQGNEAKAYPKWELIQKILGPSTKIKNVDDLINAIKSYNVPDGQENRCQWKFPVLKECFAQFSDLERNQFFEDYGVLSSIRNLAILLRELVPRCEILKTGFNLSIRLHQLQIASILANAFFCTFPRGKADCPSINFNTLFEGHSSTVSQYCIEKIKCIIHYFKRLCEKRSELMGEMLMLTEPTGSLTFHRHSIPDHKFPRWDKTTANLCSLKVDTEGKIEDQNGYIHMDFSNRYVGGGVLGRGCVQEEIRFVICPELIAARLFTECLADNESLLVVGAERYCNYMGYSNTFCFAGDHVDTTPVDSNGQRRTYLIIIDALYFHQSSEQYRESKILRELKKAFVGFKQKEGIGNLPMATGNWGCGAFGGDPQLKSLLQIMASSQARRGMLYLTFGDSVLKNQIEEVYQILKKKGINVGELYRIIRLYNKEKRKSQSVFEFILAMLQKPEKRKENLKIEGKFSSKPITSTTKPSRSSEMSARISSAPEESAEDKPLIENQKKTQPNEGSSDRDISFYNSGESFKMSDYVKFYGKMEVAENHSIPKFKNLPEENMFDMIWYENECGSSSGNRSQYQEETDKAGNSATLSPSLFSDDGDMKMTCEESVEESVSEKSKSQERRHSKKFSQPKITDFF